MNPPDVAATSTGSLTRSTEPTDSPLASAMHRLLVRHGLPAADFNADVGGRQVDVHLTGTPVVIECDRWTSHDRDRDPDGDCDLGRDHISDDERIERNRRDDAEFASHGWIVLRFTFREITTRPADVARQIRSALDRWASVSLT